MLAACRACFFPSDINLMCKAIDISTATSQGYSNVSREDIATRIISCTVSGERDPDRLALAALTGTIEPFPTIH